MMLIFPLLLCQWANISFAMSMNILLLQLPNALSYDSESDVNVYMWIYKHIIITYAHTYPHTNNVKIKLEYFKPKGQVG